VSCNLTREEQCLELFYVPVGLSLSLLLFLSFLITVEPRFNEVPGDRPNLFVKSRVRYIENLDITNFRGNDQNVRYIEVDFTFGLPDYVRYIEEFVISRFVISRPSLIRGSLNRGSTVAVFSSLHSAFIIHAVCCLGYNKLQDAYLISFGSKHLLTEPAIWRYGIKYDVLRRR